MKLVKFILLGIVFGIIMTKSEAASWFRIQEMFRFESFHMYGIIGTAVIVGAFGIWLMKKLNIKAIDGNPLRLDKKDPSFKNYLFGGTIFGFGWALTGACPGPLYTILGQGVLVMIVVIISAILGTLFYGAIRDFLPH